MGVATPCLLSRPIFIFTTTFTTKEIPIVLFYTKYTA
jgi:hypothetical protein